MSNTITPFEATELVSRANVNNRLSEANTKFNTIDGKFPVSVANGGTGGTDKTSAVVGLGIGETGETGYGGADAAAFINSIKSHFEYVNAKYVPCVFNARWIDNGYGVAAGVRTVNNLSEFLFLFNEATGPKFYVKNTGTSGDWVDYSPTGTVLYENSSGTNSTVVLSESAANYNKFKIFYFNDDSHYFTAEVESPNGKTTDLFSLWHRVSNSSVYIKVTQISISGTSITFGSNNGSSKLAANSVTITDSTNIFKIWKVVGYKY